MSIFPGLPEFTQRSFVQFSGCVDPVIATNDNHTFIVRVSVLESMLQATPQLGQPNSELLFSVLAASKLPVGKRGKMPEVTMHTFQLEQCQMLAFIVFRNCPRLPKS